MLTIRQSSNRYKLTFSDPGSGRRGWSVTVLTVENIHTAIDHYYGREHQRSACVLCEDEAKQTSHRR